VTREGLAAWVAAYEDAWRSPGTDALDTLFTEDAAYLHSPYAEPVLGLDAIARMWKDERDGPDEVFAMSSEIVAVAGDVGVARVEVRYGEPVRQEYRDLWVMRFADDGRCSHFEEWPFWPDKGWSAASSSS
jgi:ketosteroid isomerase-like protein